MSDEAQPEVDFSCLQLTPGDELTPYILASFTSLALRTHNDPATVISSLRTTLREFDPGLVVTSAGTIKTWLTPPWAARPLPCACYGSSPAPRC